ncbi:MAG TPA: isoprenylcysteine carboxylmethyltransferase family protein [Anaerolineales bacterium]|nr:isoprenylcysteine carboxylmethyltransferase family protein [Anaerolineales bacterium]
MSPKGYENLRAHVPELNHPFGLLRILGIAAVLFIFVTAFFTTEDLTWPFWLLDGEVVIGALGFILFSLFFRSKTNLLAQFGPLAYRKAFGRFALPGLAIIFAVVARIGYMPGPLIPHFWWYPALTVLGWLLVIIGVALWIRSVTTFGVDYLAMLYVYFPEESKLADHKIYQILRHPIYASAQQIAFGFALLNGNWFALTCAVFFSIGLFGFVRLVEEKELIERFGQSYLDYRKRIPAFWPRPRDLGGFFKFLLSGE